MQPTDLTWRGGEHPFALRLGELEALQQLTDSGPGEVLGRLIGAVRNGPMVSRWRVADITETLRLGLIGGGMDREKARQITVAAIERHGLPALIPTAAEVLTMALAPREDDPLDAVEEDPEQGEAKGDGPPPENGLSVASTAMAP